MQCHTCYKTIKKKIDCEDSNICDIQDASKTAYKHSDCAEIKTTKTIIMNTRKQQQQ